MTTRSALLAALSFVAATPSLAQAQRYDWQEVLPAVRPSPREYHGMVYDQARHVVLLFGGARNGPGGTDLNDTWQYDGTTWTELHPSTSPSPRSSFGMAYDPIRERVVLIGGNTLAGVYPGDVWEWDGRDWAQVEPYNASLSPGGCACYDPTLGGVLFSNRYTNVVWDGSSWRYLIVVNPDIGAGTLQMVYDPALGGPITNAGGDTRRFDTSVGWVSVLPLSSSGGRLYTMAGDPSTGRIVMMGGGVSSPASTETWICNGTGWVRLAQALPGRAAARMAFDSDRHRFVLFGGWEQSSPPIHRNDTWELTVYDQIASYQTYGQGCGGPPAEFSADPAFGGRPFLGGNLTMRATQLPPGQPFIHCLGTSDSLWLGQSLPFDLGPIGASGCSVLAALDIAEDVGTSSATGELHFTIRVPNQLPLAGARFFHQLVGLAPGLNPAGLIVTNGGAGTIGVR